jgi:hypothetical protein
MKIIFIIIIFWSSLFAEDNWNRLNNAIDRLIITDGQIAFPKDYAFNSIYEQEVLYRSFSFFNSIEKIITSRNTNQGVKSNPNIPIYAALEHLKYMLSKGSFFALATSESIIKYFDGEIMESFPKELLWYKLSYFPDYNKYMGYGGAKKSAKYFCYSLAQGHEYLGYYFPKRGPNKIYNDIKKNKVYDFIDEVKKIDGCLEKLEEFKDDSILNNKNKLTK